MSLKDQVVEAQVPSQKLGTFTGVFLPTILVTLGVILYLRMGWIVSSCGLVQTLSIISVATLVILISALSISSTATNMSMGSGGIYYLLSRTFGIEVGSSMGIPFFFAQTLSIALYISGLSESLHAVFPMVPSLMISTSILAILALLSSVSIHFASKTQLLTFALIMGSLLSVFLGSLQFPLVASPTFPPHSHFWLMFALFLPAITGIENGLAMTKDLKNPRFSIPFGMLSAIGITFIVYIITALMLFYRIPQELLASSPMVMESLSLIKHLSWVGLWASSLSAALTTLLATPQTLQALAKDRIIPSLMGKKFSTALIITLALVYLSLFLGNLDRIAPVLSMFFLLSYGVLNLNTAVEALMDNPSWRPTLKIHWSVSLFGAFLCFFCMLMIDVTSTLFSFAVLLLIYLMMKKRQLEANWDDISYSIMTFLSRFAIYRLCHLKPSAKSWRPNLLVFVGDPFLRAHLITLTAAFTHRKGFLTIASILDTEFKKDQDISFYKENLDDFLAQHAIPSLVELLRHKNVFEGMSALIKNYGIGPIFPNTIVLGSTEKKENFLNLSEMILLAYSLHRNLMIVKETNLECRSYNYHKNKKNKQIDVWWGGFSKSNSELMLVLAYMLQTSHDWKGSTLTLRTIVNHSSDVLPMKKQLEEFSQTKRLHISTEVLLTDPQKDIFKDIIYESSKHSDLIFLGLKPPLHDSQDYALYYEELLSKTSQFPPVAFVLAGEAMDFAQILQ